MIKNMDCIRIIFVQPTNENETSDIMQQAFEACEQHVKEVKWENEVNLIGNLTTTDIVIFEKFTGETFEKIKKSNSARILGPWCLLVCIKEGKPIPNSPWPIANVALYNCVVACSNLPKPTRSVIRDRVEAMGGCFTNSWHSNNTHLVTDTVKTEKYLCAAESRAKIMIPEWIESVWEASQIDNVHGDDEQFMKFRCLPFQNLTICITGFRTKSERCDLEQLISLNGGKFRGELNTSDTDVLIYADGTNSAKYVAAKKSCSIKCVNVDWITGSINKGYALSFADYGYTSFDNSVLSCTNSKDIRKRKVFSHETFNALLKNLDIKEVKKAGQFLDGCSLYVAGVTIAEYREKLCKIINLSGATRYDDISDRVTHVIVGDPQSQDVKLIRTKGYNCALVTINWLIDSIDKQQPVCEENYLISAYADLGQNDLKSPLCKKGLSLLRSNKTITQEEDLPPQVPPNDTNQDHDDILRKYLKNSPNQEQLSNKQVTEESTTQNEFIFDNLKLITNDFQDLEEEAFIKEQIEQLGGTIVSKNFKGIVDYIVVPVIIYNEIRHSSAEIVNSIFITECIQENNLINIEYYHKPIVVPNENVKPLDQCVITISTYSGFERMFLKDIVEPLGGIAQEQLSRITSIEKQIVASTHLVSSEATGKKYTAALKWEIPVVDKNWLLQCAQTGKFVSEQKYLIGDSKVQPQKEQNFVKPKYLNKFPDFILSSKEKRNCTPLSEFKGRILNKLQNNSFNHHETQEESVEQQLVNTKLQLMEDMLNSGNSNGTRRSNRVFQPIALEQEFLQQPDRDSQTNTVGWSYGISEPMEENTCSTTIKVFMLSGIDINDRQLFTTKLESLGAIVSQLANYDPTSTHLICPKPSRNEKTLSCIAAGKWILHTNFLEKSIEAGRFLDEEEFEFGNPKSVGNVIVDFDKDTDIRMQSIHWWRKEINRRGCKAFHDMRAVIVANKRESIIRVIEAGGGAIVDASPPFGDSVHATHCLLEVRSVSDLSDYVPLAQQGIFCVNILYVSDYLHRTSKDIRDCILPYFKKYY